jgi:hypothetical protein
MMTDYERSDDKLCADWRAGSGVFRFEAGSIRRTNTGVHATLSVLWNGQRLSWSHVNIERDETRVKLVNSAYKHMTKVKDKPTVNETKFRLDNFCAGLWDTFCDQCGVELLHGDSNPTPIVRLLDPYIIEGGGTITFAPPGAGKSWLSLLMAVSVDAGVNTIWPVSQVPTLYVNLERSRMSMRRRLTFANRALGLEGTRPLAFLQARGRGLLDVDHSIQRAVREKGIGLIIVDSISRTGMGDLNENQPANKTIDCLNSLSESWFAIGHPPRASANHVYGSVHWDAGADILVQLESELRDDELGISLRGTKANDIKPPPLAMYALKFNEIGLKAVRNADPNEFPRLAERDETTVKTKVWEFLRDVGAMSATEVATELNLDRSAVAHAFSDRNFFSVKDREGRKVLYQAILHTSVTESE